LDDTAKQLFDFFLGCFWVGPAKLLFEDQPLDSLRRPHRAAAPQLRVIESVDEV
jgi:hypothetical protein